MFALCILIIGQCHCTATEKMILSEHKVAKEIYRLSIEERRGDTLMGRGKETHVTINQYREVCVCVCVCVLS